MKVNRHHKFDVVIGNPPYQKMSSGDNGKYMPSIYPEFMDRSFDAGHIVELITPARFLFGAGKYPKGWVEKTLDDEHFKVVYFNQKSKEVFSDVEIKGGVAVSYRDDSLDFGKIGTFIPYEELKGIVDKVTLKTEHYLPEIIIPSCTKISETAVELNPDVFQLMRENSTLQSNSFEKLYGKLFFDEPPTSDSVAVYGRLNNKRVWLWADRRFVESPKNFNKYKILVTRVSGDGAYGERFAPMVIVPPDTGYTNSFRAFGCFDNEDEAKSLLKYLKTCFVRSLVGVFKNTQQFPPRVFNLVPIQDFSSSSDIDWSESIHDIDSQLYEKYGLNDDEIGFIESHVKKMS